MKQKQPSRPVILPWLLIAGVILLLIVLVPSGNTVETPEVEISQVVQMAQQGRLLKIEVQNDDLKVTTGTGETYKSRKETGVSVFDILEEANIDASRGQIQIEVKEEGTNFFSVILPFLPLLLFGGLMIYFFTRAGEGSTRLKAGARAGRGLPRRTGQR
jgi:cell division protease FtsH